MTKRAAGGTRGSLTELGDLAKALGHPVRLRLLAMLASGPLCVCQMTAVVGLAFSTVSGHLTELRRSGLVLEQKRGKWVEYRVADTSPVERLLKLLLPWIEDDPQVAADRELIAGVRDVPLDSLCRARLDLEAVGLTRPSVPGRSKTSRAIFPVQRL